MFLAAILGGLVAAVASMLLSRLLGAARQRIPRWFVIIPVAYVRAAAAAVFGLSATTGISLSTSDHRHEMLAYIVWYGVAGLGLVLVLATTILIDRGRSTK